MKRLISFVLFFIATIAFAQMPPMQGGGPQPGPRPQQPGPDQDPVGRELFPPDLIMGHQEELQLKDTQRATLRSEMVKLQTKIIDMQFQMSEDGGKLAAMLRSTPIDEAKTLEQADKVMSLERDIKRLHLSTLIRIKNMLTPDQVAKLQEIRRKEQR